MQTIILGNIYFSLLRLCFQVYPLFDLNKFFIKVLYRFGHSTVITQLQRQLVFKLAKLSKQILFSLLPPSSQYY